MPSKGRWNACARDARACSRSNHTLMLGWSPQVFTDPERVDDRQREPAQCRASSSWRIRTRWRWRMRSASGSRSGEGRASSAAAGVPSTRTTSRSPARIRRNPSSSCRPKATTPIPMSSRPCWRSPTIRTAAPNALSHRHPDPQGRRISASSGSSASVTTCRPCSPSEIIARVVAQTSRQSGLSVVYTELMNFGGDEIYFKNETALAGKTFGEALLAVRRLLRAGSPQGGRGRSSSAHAWTCRSQAATRSLPSPRTTTRSTSRTLRLRSAQAPT
ncbi:MAG: hypothetical protein MZV64_60440 [Ignavibacteriales bacterium]|nr:hypothetical protein [Ignavibacteriales bacterium]